MLLKILSQYCIFSKILHVL